MPQSKPPIVSPEYIGSSPNGRCNCLHHFETSFNFLVNGIHYSDAKIRYEEANIRVNRGGYGVQHQTEKYNNNYKRKHHIDNWVVMV